MRGAAWTMRRASRVDEAGGTDEGDNRGWQNEGSGMDEVAQMRCAAWTRGPGGQHK